MMFKSSKRHIYQRKQYSLFFCLNTYGPYLICAMDPMDRGDGSSVQTYKPQEIENLTTIIFFFLGFTIW